MKTFNKILSTIVLLTLVNNISYANNDGDNGFDFSVEHSIWGAGPTKAIEPEIKKEASPSANETVVTPFEKFDLSDLAADQDKRREELIKQLLKKRQVKAPIPFYNDESHSHLGICFTGGISNLITQTDFGKTTGSFTPGFMIDYYYFFNQSWGARLGIGLTYSRCRFKSNKAFRDTSSYIDFEGDTVGLGYKIGNVNEKFTTLMLEVPVMAAYTKNDWLFAAGFKFGFPLSIKYDQKLSDVDITGYYNFAEPIYSAKALGAMEDKTSKKKGKFTDTPVYVMVGANIGRKFRLTDMFDLGASLYVDYSLNSLTMRSQNDKANYQGASGEYYLIHNEELTDENILTREEPGAKTNTASTLCSKRISDGKRIINDIKYFDAGIKISLYFSSYANGTKEARKEVERKAALMQ